MTLPLVTIIIPMFKVESSIERCIESALSQTYNNIEVLCIDDCSPDKSLMLAKNKAISDNRVKCYSCSENVGLGRARDYGLSKANGEFVFFLDSDDYIDKEYIKHYVRYFENADILIGGYTREEPSGSREIIPSNTMAGPWLFPSACTRAFRLSFLKENGIDFRKIRYYEDVIFNYRCLSHNPTIKILNYCGYHYVQNDSSITRSKNSLERYQSYIDGHLSFFNEGEWKNFSSKDKQLLVYSFYQYLTIGLLVNARHSGLSNAHKMIELRNSCLKKTFPDYLCSPYIQHNAPEGEQQHIKKAIKCYYLAERLHIDKFLISLLSI